MNSTNHRCNAFQILVGIFTHSCGTPETVREFLAHAGLSVSTTTINEAINNLARESNRRMQKHGRTLLTLYAYDNLDIDLKHSTPSFENHSATLIHLTSATMLPLSHRASLHDLKCSDELRNQLHANPDGLPVIPITQLLAKVYPDTTRHPSGLWRRQRFNAWKFLHDLVHFGPEAFRGFRERLDKPEEIDVILPEKTTQVPMQAMDIKPSTPAENADALEHIFQQSGIGDPNEHPMATGLGDHVALVCGDLLTVQHIRSLKKSRSVETTPWHRFQFVVPVMGLFHLKMACADALWRIFIFPKQGRQEANSLMSHVGQIRPRETNKIETKPGFRRMHEVIQHVGIATRLDIWRIEAGKKMDQELMNLDDFAATNPSWKDLQDMAYNLARNYVAQGDIATVQMEGEGTRDQQKENMLLRLQYFSIYEELSYGLNHGDMGRVENLFFELMYIFRGCGKHKYAAELRIYLENLHFHYPSPLR